MKKVIMIIVVLTIMVGCNSKKDPVKENNAEEQVVDQKTTVEEKVETNKGILDTVKKNKFSTFSLNELLTALSNNPANAMIRLQIFGHHEIEETIYNGYRSDFWDGVTPTGDTNIKYEKAALEVLINAGKGYDFVRFNPTPKPECDDIKPEYTNVHKPSESCYPIAFFKYVVDNYPDKTLEMTKGKRKVYIDSDADGKIDETKDVEITCVCVIFKLKTSPLHTYYYDIIEDPSRTYP